MALVQNIAIIKIGYNSYALEDVQDALQMMAIMGKAVQVDDSLYSVREFTDVSHCLSDDQTMPELKFIAPRKLDGHRTCDEIKEQGEREKKDREDVNQNMKDVTVLELPAPKDDGIPF